MKAFNKIFETNSNSFYLSLIILNIGNGIISTLFGNHGVVLFVLLMAFVISSLLLITNLGNDESPRHHQQTK